jgi:2-amino-4-hydroxy-6-hydroxymethyldihydropteridine diphosphokinase
MSSEARVFVALGSNIEPREEYLRAAVGALRTIGEVLAISSVYETLPLGGITQSNYLNAVVEVRTALGAKELLSSLKAFERQLGRLERPRWHEREIDFDIVFYDNLIINSPQLTIPHPEIQVRSFVLTPMADLDANFVHPVLKESIQELLLRVDSAGVHKTSIELS